MKNLFLILALISGFSGFAQIKTASSVDVSGFAGKASGVSLAYNYNWKLGAGRKFEVGLGARFTVAATSNKYYITAPAKLTSGKTGPGVLFAENIEANIDSVLFEKTTISSFNLAINLGYQVSPRLYAGFNIDALGFSFGANRSGRYFSNGTGVTTTAKPTGFNALLISDNDKGSLNSELFIRYRLKRNLGLRAGVSFLFQEYTTDTRVQTVAGEQNDRFRYKALSPMVGLSWNLN